MDRKKVIEALQTLKDECDSARCCYCEIQHECTWYFDEHPYKWDIPKLEVENGTCKR